MILINGDWSGHITGTNNANVFVVMEQNESVITGTARINDHVHGMSVYNIKGSLEKNTMQMQMTPDSKFFNKPKKQSLIINNQEVTITLPTGQGTVTLNANVINLNHIEGTWVSTIGTGGKIFLERAILTVEKENSNTLKKSVFISYAHVDNKYLKRLKVHLKPLEKKGVVEIWDDTKIEVGKEWKKEIEKALEKSAIAVLIISADFLASDFILDNELPPILSKAQLDGTKIVPVILKPCRFSRDPNLSKFQALNSPDVPVQGMSEIKQEELWNRLSQVIEGEI